MPQAVGEFLQEHVNRGRKLLAESDEHRNDADLQVSAVAVPPGGGGGGRATALSGLSVCTTVFTTLNFHTLRRSLPHCQVVVGRFKSAGECAAAAHMRQE